MSLFALSDCSIEMCDRFFGVGISIGVLSGLRFDERFLGVVQEGIAMSLRGPAQWLAWCA
jgi:hypothetical protein